MEHSTREDGLLYSPNIGDAEIIYLNFDTKLGSATFQLKLENRSEMQIKFNNVTDSFICGISCVNIIDACYIGKSDILSSNTYIYNKFGQFLERIDESQLIFCLTSSTGMDAIICFEFISFEYKAD